MFWLIIFGSMLLAAAAGLIYLVTRFHRFSAIKKLSEKHMFVSWIAAILPVAAIFGAFSIINITASIVVIIHLMVFWLIADLIAAIVRKVRKKERGKNIEGICAILFTAVYLSFGWYFAHHVYRTEYTVTTQKHSNINGLKIVGIADSHLGITLDGEKFAKEMERVQEENPDVVLVAGDFVDDDSDKADMIRSCEALGQLDTKYGVYFIFGNHDKGYYQGYRNFSEDELRTELEKNGIIILEDESVLVDDRFYIIGRQDKTEEDRAAMDELVKDLDSSKYMILLDHQPNDYANEAAADVDLVFSGHTHGGHIFPAGYIGLWLKANDRVYGTETRGNTQFIVTSGISGWAIPFKTGTISEYVVMDISEE